VALNTSYYNIELQKALEAANHAFKVLWEIIERWTKKPSGRPRI
jgi:hypothetical protein